MKAITAYPELERELGRQIREAAVDYESFSQRLKLCEFGSCRATCCHDGVYLTDEEQQVIGEVIQTGKARLEKYGWTGEAWLTNEGGRAKSITLENEDPGARFPAHFPQTRCVFLDAGHRCVLQRLAMDEGRHPWFWKPISCWMHPLVLKPGERGGRPLLMLPEPGNDPSAKRDYPGFSSCTPCGMNVADGKPATEVLREELGLLGKIACRDLVAELEAGLDDQQSPSSKPS